MGLFYQDMTYSLVICQLVCISCYIISSAYFFEVETYNDKVKTLEEKIGSMITNEDADLATKLELIDDVQRLGLGYRFQEDIKDCP